MKDKWRVIYVASRREKKVQDWLSKTGMKSYLPLVSVKRQWSDRLKTVEVPLFNGYLFVMANEKQRDQVLQTPGVVKFIQYNGTDAFISEGMIESLKIAIASGHTFLNTEEVSVKAGNRVMVTAGPFSGIEGRVASHKNNNYVLIELESIGKQMCIKIEKSYLKNVGAKVG